MLYRRLGYTEDVKEMLADEAEWFVAIDLAIGRANKALEKARKG